MSQHWMEVVKGRIRQLAPLLSALLVCLCSLALSMIWHRTKEPFNSCAVWLSRLLVGILLVLLAWSVDLVIGSQLRWCFSKLKLGIGILAIWIGHCFARTGNWLTGSADDRDRLANWCIYLQEVNAVLDSQVNFLFEDRKQLHLRLEAALRSGGDEANRSSGPGQVAQLTHYLKTALEQLKKPIPRSATPLDRYSWLWQSWTKARKQELLAENGLLRKERDELAEHLKDTLKSLTQPDLSKYNRDTSDGCPQHDELVLQLRRLKMGEIFRLSKALHERWLALLARGKVSERHQQEKANDHSLASFRGKVARLVLLSAQEAIDRRYDLSQIQALVRQRLDQELGELAPELLSDEEFHRLLDSVLVKAIPLVESIRKASPQGYLDFPQRSTPYHESQHETVAGSPTEPNSYVDYIVFPGYRVIPPSRLVVKPLIRTRL